MAAILRLSRSVWKGGWEHIQRTEGQLRSLSSQSINTAGKTCKNRPNSFADLAGRIEQYGVQAGRYHKFFYPAGYPVRNDTGKGAMQTLVESLRHNPVDTARDFAQCLTPAERGALMYALRRKNTVDGIEGLEEAFLEADSNMDGKLSRYYLTWNMQQKGDLTSYNFREEFKVYMAIRSEQKKTATMTSSEKPTRRQLGLVAFASGVPFIGFGFCDNAIMLLAGEGIEASLGLVLGITTLAAAGLGNLISDVVGLGLADYIEAWARRNGVVEPALSSNQRTMPITRGARFSGAAIGVAMGCLLGMIPLFFFDHKPKEKVELSV